MSAQAASVLAAVITAVLGISAQVYYLHSTPFHGYHRPLRYVPTPTLDVPRDAYCGRWYNTMQGFHACMRKPVPR